MGKLLEELSPNPPGDYLNRKEYRTATSHFGIQPTYLLLDAFSHQMSRSLL